MPAQDIRTDPESQASPPATASRDAAGSASDHARAPDFLEEMRQAALERLPAGLASSPAPRLEGRSSRSLRGALAAAARRHGCGLIAELKRRSPSAGALREDLDPAALARSYAEAGAAAVSVLTEPTRFGGSLADLERAASGARVPVLRKDFLLGIDQIRESREAGADAVLLIVRLLDPARLRDLLAASDEAGLEALVEVHEPAELRIANEAGAALVGVNNRDLATLQTDVSHSLALARRVREEGWVWPELVVSESGIRARAQVEELARAGYHAVLVGETLLRAPDPARAVRELLGREEP
jgi:indole-3-glycerol phosphate synthase